jgi:hypothetical protein
VRKLRIQRRRRAIKTLVRALTLNILILCGVVILTGGRAFALSFSAKVTIPSNNTIGNVDCPDPPRCGFPATCTCLVWAGNVSTPLGRNTGVQFSFSRYDDSQITTSGGGNCYQGSFDLILQGGRDSEEWIGPAAMCTTLNGSTQVTGGAVLIGSDVFSAGTAEALATIPLTTGSLALTFSGVLLP